MTTKTVFQTDHLGIYTGETFADLSPVEPDVWLIPGGCVEIAPPLIPAHQAARWNGRAWTLIESYQGETVYQVGTGQPLVIDRPGPLPAGYTLQAPSDHQVWSNDQWVDDMPTQLQIRHAEQLQAVNSACEREIVGGFASDALGELHIYDSALPDQINLNSQLLSGAGGLVACRDIDSVKAYREHTAEQLHLVSDAFNEHRLARLQKALLIKQQMDQALLASDLSALEAVSWEVVEV
ncbi:hypothetical protein PS903_01028 [Pseudomonas fluorescens]|nr:hypothetical protein PS903_01028 [Pseudomonas fluorescens]